MSRRILELNGPDWRLGRAPRSAEPQHAAWQELPAITDWLPASVPGNVRADLIRSGRLPPLDSYAGIAAAWEVDDACWWLVRTFGPPARPGERVHLVLRGVDYVSDLFLNGHHLGRHEGMFSPQVHDVSGLLAADNQLAVRITGNRWLPTDRSSRWEKLLNHFESWTGNLPAPFPHRRDTLKCQMSFGWDFAPPLRPMGLWDDVYLVIGGGVLIQDLVCRSQLDGGRALLTLELGLDAHQADTARIRCQLRPETFDGQTLSLERTVEVPGGNSRHGIELAVPDPRLWWPWDHGQPDLYRLEVEVWTGDRRSDALDQSVGLRQIEMQDWTLAVNGRPVYARGANWVPADLLPGRVTREDYRDLLHLARGAGMNMLRVWGGGLREKQTFYDLCDRLGILVWQEFPLACAFVTRYPRSAGFLQLLAAEARAIVRDLRHHPSLALWCGGNEFSPRRHEPLITTLGRVLDAEDPTRPFLPASPAGGDSHNWQVWHEFQPPSAYLHDRAAFASEFGLQAPPAAATLGRFLPAGDLWPPGPVWQQHGADLAKLERYARPFLPGGQAAGLEEFVEASQRAQVHGLQIAVEHYRRRKAAGGGGVLIWQFNEPWPAISWALVDFYRQPKPAYEAVKRLLAPLLVSLDFGRKQYRPGDAFRAAVWLINDQDRPRAGCELEVALWAGGREPGEMVTWAVAVPALGAEIVGHVDWILPASRGWRVACRLRQGGHILAGNEYDLTAYDGIRPSLRQRLRAWLSARLIPD